MDKVNRYLLADIEFYSTLIKKNVLVSISSHNYNWRLNFINLLGNPMFQNKILPFIKRVHFSTLSSLPGFNKVGEFRNRLDIRSSLPGLKQVREFRN